MHGKTMASKMATISKALAFSLYSTKFALIGLLSDVFSDHWEAKSQT